MLLGMLCCAGASAGTEHIEAESATLSGGATAASDHAGYLGTGFAAGFIDGNKGSAQAAFGVSADKAGDYTLSMRYANGTGAPKTLTLLVDGVAATQVSFAPTASWDAWATQSSVLTFSAGPHTVAYKFGSADSGNLNLDALDFLSPAAKPAVEAENWFMSGGAVVATDIAGFNGAGYVSGFGTTGARTIRTVFMGADGAATATVRYANPSGSSRSLDVYVNGAKTTQLALPAGAGWLKARLPLTLRTGLNTVSLQGAGAGAGVGIDSMKFSGELSAKDRGATVRFTTYEAEAASTNAAVRGPDRTPLTVESESSGRSLVRLSQKGHQVSFTLAKAANSIVVRYSIPDAPGGGGQPATLALYANGTKLRDLSLSSKYAWVYGDYPFRGVPADGSPRHFYDETRALIGDWPKGTVLTLQKDDGNNAAYYDIDLIDTETVGAALATPPGVFSIASYGAKADGSDSTGAFKAAIAAAQPTQGTVWIPAGTFNITSLVNLSGVTVRGAGPWYSAVQLGPDGRGGFFAVGNDITLADFAIYGQVTLRDPDGTPMTDAPLEGNFGTGSLLQNLWFEHTKVGMWINTGTNGLYAVGLRIRDTFADGVNLHAGVQDTWVDQSVVRNTGDDALAMFSEGLADTACAFVHDTVQSPVLANGIAIYGGNGNRAESNVVHDTVSASAGIAISTRFNPVPFSGSTLVQHNTLVRTGGWEPNWKTAFGGVWVFANTSDISAPVVLRDMKILQSTYQGVLVSDVRNVNGLVMDGLTIDGATTYGMEFNAPGSATLSNVHVSNATLGGLHGSSSFVLTLGPGNSGF